jgi:hypothetical protein
MVTAFLEMLTKRGGQLWKEEVPKPCRICGVGSYEAQSRLAGQPGASIAVALNRFVNGVDRHLGMLRMEPFICDRCGHVQFFRSR